RDWSSDVCSSDLTMEGRRAPTSMSAFSHIAGALETPYAVLKPEMGCLDGTRRIACLGRSRLLRPRTADFGPHATHRYPSPSRDCPHDRRKLREPVALRTVQRERGRRPRTARSYRLLAGAGRYGPGARARSASG